MNKKAIWITVIVVVLIVVGISIWYYYQKNNGTTTSSSTERKIRGIRYRACVNSTNTGQCTGDSTNPDGSCKDAAILSGCQTIGWG